MEESSHVNACGVEGLSCTEHVKNVDRIPRTLLFSSLLRRSSGKQQQVERRGPSGHRPLRAHRVPPAHQRRAT
ncbi:hypothetical protein CH63R_05908 [Colletotrichum higginsianum IMI 349063]|uniref:Uncharacterized protein n=1 Tax=Colletotrichum higginsianum (strain IMI 349063) TaxID=759273 RepID=A0A1B7YDP0_COLHI|nr:hypothetical protein CH63R_05908 [Colletotrichum higginsianum IMI 349063]OBR10216.1 hypothetical protein CH63R_05908 [Colletotrichum higginsianum IMI 349063]